MQFVIYGAQGIALGTYRAIKTLYPKREISCFLVTEIGMNDDFLDGMPVVELKDFVYGLSDEEKDDVDVLIATPENVMSEIENALDEVGLHNHVRMTSQRWNMLMSYYFTQSQEFKPLLCAPVGCHKAKLDVYMAKFYKDKPLMSDYIKADWITPVQVGAALTEVRIADVLDCEGDNISEKNVNYSELTALYWIWKHKLIWLTDEKITSADCKSKESEYYGLVHYRRIMELSEDDIYRLVDNDIDAVLPYPMPYQPNIHAHHKRYLMDVDWRAMLTALRELQPEYAERVDEIFGQQYLYNYNIIIAKKKVLKEYCEWLFPILERTEELSVPKGDERADRYIGYMGETLSTLYFMVNKDRLNIVHTGCIFLT